MLTLRNLQKKIERKTPETPLNNIESNNSNSKRSLLNILFLLQFDFLILISNLSQNFQQKNEKKYLFNLQQKFD